MIAYQKELWDIVMANKQKNPMVSIRAIESLHSLTNDIARIVDLAPSMAGGDSVKSSDVFSLHSSRCFRDTCLKLSGCKVSSSPRVC